MLRCAHIGMQMKSDRWDSGPRFARYLWLLILVFMGGSLSACTAAAGGGILAVLIGVSALTSHCYDYLDVTVFDAQGRKTCDATVTASRENSSEHFELQSCYYAPLSDGHWRLRASMPGSTDVETLVQVDHEKECTRHVQSAELTLSPAGTPARASTPASTATPAISATIAPEPPTTNSSPPAMPAATSAAEPGGAGGSSSASPATSGGTSSVGVFPLPSPSSP